MKKSFDFRGRSLANKRRREYVSHDWENMDEEYWEGCEQEEEDGYEETAGYEESYDEEYYGEEYSEEEPYYEEEQYCEEEYYEEEQYYEEAQYYEGDDEGEETEEFASEEYYYEEECADAEYAEEGYEEEYVEEYSDDEYCEDNADEYYEEESEEYYEEDYEEYVGEDTEEYYQRDGYTEEESLEEEEESSSILPAGKWMDYLIMFSAGAMILIAIILGGIYLLKDKSGSNEENVQQVGNQLDGIHMIGEEGLMAMSDAQKAMQALAQLPQATESPEGEADNPQYDEEEYKIDISVKLSFTSIEKDLKIKFLNKDTGKLVGNVPFGIEVTDAEGKTSFWSDDDMDGIIYKKNLVAGKYTVKICELEGEKYKTYGIPTEESKVEVKSKLVYEKVDVAAEIKTESQVDVNKEDTKNNNSIAEEYMQDTVVWVESTVVTETFEEITQENIPNPLTLVLRGDFVRLSAEGGVIEPTATPTVAPAATPTVEPTATPTAEPTATPTAEPTATPTAEPTATPTAVPTATPTAVPTATPTVAPTVTPTVAPSPTPTVAPTATPAPKVEKVELEKKTAAVYIGDGNAIEIGITTTPGQLETLELSAASSDATIAKAEIRNGKLVVTGLKEGQGVTITVTAKTGDCSVQAGCTIQVKTSPKDDMQTLLKDNQGREVFVLENDKYRNAYYADYFNFSKFYVRKAPQYTGWQTLDGKVMYFDAAGKYITGEQVIQGVKYQFASDGALVTGTGTMGIDVSKWNGKIDWNAVKNSGVSYVIIRCGYRGSSQGSLIVDSKFKENIKGANAAGLKVGVYFFTQAVDKNEALEEASMVLELIKDYKITYPVFLDVEPSGGRADGLDVATRTEICKTFCETIKQYGYTPGIYANKNWLEGKLDMNVLNAYKVWLAQYASEPTYQGRYDMWQYKDTGKISGVTGNVDLNRSYLGY